MWVFHCKVGRKVLLCAIKMIGRVRGWVGDQKEWRFHSKNMQDIMRVAFGPVSRRGSGHDVKKVMSFSMKPEWFG